ncbi:23S rRNA (uracil(1939)-C(5))-methyltransferase RlmD [Colwellia ponticola]|uniref:23S rRNA (uracil(1939)-C(5))-methyltransferase RlmD n=1 Tax=Colwellia ponticola TaxID=2304625 RepID=A0A8H2JQT5_9GAMM|nr:23S rRNA (uracil(1939)-C(5))-methyltransferase RlmD [Colwellia ponticola]TMM47469.1 23S rRNA (uracil(1939)-C(5))-methyltransferase RlmD [Colwellia ponticola]
MANYFKAAVKATEKNKRLTVSIDKLDMNGVGVARWQNKPVFIAGALPNETVEVQVIEQKSKYVRAKLIAVNQQSEQRVIPKCQHFALCGGCDLQMLAITAQLDFKQGKVSELFSRSFSAQKLASTVTPTTLPWQPAIISNPWHYRRKARIGVQFDKKSHAIIGFRQKGTNDLASIKSCPVLVEPLDAIFPLLKKLLAQLTVQSAIGHIEVIQADITKGGNVEDKSIESKTTDNDKVELGIVDADSNKGLVNHNQVVLVVRQLKAMNDADIELWQRYAQQHNWHVMIDDGHKQQPLVAKNTTSQLFYTLADNNKINFASSDFIQINHQVNNAMISQALAWLAISPADTVLDLFCGLGNFSLALANKAKFVIGVEGVQVMVDKATDNAQHNGYNNCQFYQADLNSDWLTQSWASAQVFDKVLLDPARAGAEQAVGQIATLKIPKVLYVSCDPATLARDSAILIAQGYKLEKISLMDMFSQTKHVETMVLFTQ